MKARWKGRFALAGEKIILRVQKNIIELSERFAMAEQLYIFCWANNTKRKSMKDRICRVLVRGKMNTALIEFIDNGEKCTVSRNALRKIGN